MCSYHLVERETDLLNALGSSLACGLVLGSVYILTQSVVALSNCRSRIVHVMISASAVAVSTVQKVTGPRLRSRSRYICQFVKLRTMLFVERVYLGFIKLDRFDTV